ncbi:hypothetical protein A3H10_04640 [Candidatus Uhrbacteria bacterium RIFCSPLOWO2_12_FULL_46_10]|nr:MAG: hypothetical protein A3H10_04640 [Candidatus Uhrbacteria bacterium RIFCSPLOWO2_12_FULL_46_10]
MLRLVANTEEATSASIPMRWCIGRDTLALLQAKGALNPHLLLVVANKHYEVARRLVPIDQMMEYIDFQKPGKHKVLATIVWNSQGNARVLKKRIFGGRAIDINGQMHHFTKMSVLDDEGDLDILDDRRYNPANEFAICALDEGAQIEVNVAEGFFAAPPSKVEQFWVNFWFERPPRDQCQFRRRRMLAYIVQPPVVLLYMLAKTMVRFVVALFLLLYGKRGVNLRPLIHPWVLCNNDIWWTGRNKGSIFTRKKSGRDQELILTLFIPIIHVVVVTAAYVATYFQHHLSFWQVVGLGEGIVITVVALLYIFGAVVWLVNTVGDTIPGTAANLASLATLLLVVFIIVSLAIDHPLFAAMILAIVGVSWLASRLATIETRKLKALPEDERKRILLEREYVNYQPVACNGPMVARYSALPKERRTVYLFYRDLKAKVCKQFAA